MDWIDFLKTEFKSGDLVWITDYRITKGILDKPIRHIKPTLVMVFSNTGNLPTNKTVYYSDYHFKRLNTKGEPVKSKIVAPFDNTGFRSFRGVALKVFLTEQEATTHYTQACKELQERAIEAKADMVKGYDAFILKMEESIYGTG